MNLESLKNFAPTCADFISVLPETFLVCAALLVFFLSTVFTSKVGDRILSIFSLLLIFSAMVVTVSIRYYQASGYSFSEMLAPTGAFTLFAFLCALLTGAMAYRYMKKDPSQYKSEYYGVLMICLASMCIFVRAEHLILFFVALECMTIAFYALISWSRNSKICLEGSIKYMIISGVSGAIGLLGIVFVYGASLKANIDFLYFENFACGLNSNLFCAGMLLIFASILFKLGAFPFQFWVSDVYQAAPNPTTSFLAVASKASALFVIYNIVVNMQISSEKVYIIACVIASITILVGNLPALVQTNTKRLMALSGVSNTGYLLLLICAVLKFYEFKDISFKVMSFYFLSYAFASYAIFIVMNLYKNADDSMQKIEDYRGMLHKDKIATTSLIIALASLAGIPPTAGFFAKLFVILVAWQAELYIPLAIMIVGSVISIYYYFSWMRASFNSAENVEYKFGSSKSAMVVLLALSATTLLFGLSSFYLF